MEKKLLCLNTLCFIHLQYSYIHIEASILPTVGQLKWKGKGVMQDYVRFIRGYLSVSNCTIVRL